MELLTLGTLLLPYYLLVKFLFIELIQKNQHRICKYKRFIGLCPNPFYYNISVDMIQVVFRLCRSDMIAKAIVLLKPIGFSVILFALNCRRQYNYAKHHITAEQYHSLNVMRRIKLRDFLIRSLANDVSFFLHFIAVRTSSSGLPPSRRCRDSLHSRRWDTSLRTRRRLSRSRSTVPCNLPCRRTGGRSPSQSR